METFLLLQDPNIGKISGLVLYIGLKSSIKFYIDNFFSEKRVSSPKTYAVCSIDHFCAVSTENNAVWLRLLIFLFFLKSSFKLALWNSTTSVFTDRGFDPCNENALNQSRQDFQIPTFFFILKLFSWRTIGRNSFIEVSIDFFYLLNLTFKNFKFVSRHWKAHGPNSENRESIGFSRKSNLHSFKTTRKIPLFKISKGSVLCRKFIWTKT